MSSQGRSTPGSHILVIVAAAIVALGALAVTSGLIPTPDVGRLLARGTSSIGAWMYFVVAAFGFFETAAFVGLVVPGELAILAGGAAAANRQVKRRQRITVIRRGTSCDGDD